MQTVISSLDVLRRAGQKFGPYLMLEILLPGGTLFALLLFLYRRRHLDPGSRAPLTSAALRRAFTGMAEPCFELQRCTPSAPMSKSGFADRLPGMGNG